MGTRAHITGERDNVGTRAHMIRERDYVGTRAQSIGRGILWGRARIS